MSPTDGLDGAALLRGLPLAAPLGLGKSPLPSPRDCDAPGFMSRDWAFGGCVFDFATPSSEAGVGNPSRICSLMNSEIDGNRPLDDDSEDFGEGDPVRG